MEGGRRHTTTGSEIKDSVTQSTTSSGCMAMFMLVSLSWHEDGVESPRQMLHTLWVCTATEKHWCWESIFFITNSKQNWFVPEADITSPIKATFWEHDPDKWPQERAVTALHSWQKKTCRSPKGLWRTIFSKNQYEHVQELDVQLDRKTTSFTGFKFKPLSLGPWIPPHA